MFRTKIKRFTSKKQLAAILALGLLVFVSQTHPLIAQAVTQGYNTDDPLQRGMLVKLKKDDATKVTFLTNESVADMLGVVVSPNDAPFTVSSDGQQVFVANTGKYTVLVSDQNGAVNLGDLVTISAISGIGMKAGTTQSLVLGKAVSGFDGKQAVLSTAKIKDSNGLEQTVSMGLATVDIDITKNPLLKGEANVPSFLRKASETIAQKQVNANRVYLGVVILALTSLLSGVVLFSGIRSSITALGRNPLSRKTIIRGMVQIIITSVIIFLCGLFGVYLLLKL